jgi:hypothetical protein
MPRAVCYVAALGLRLSGEQECMWKGPEHTRTGLDTCKLRTSTWALSKVSGPLCGQSGPRTGGGGSRSHSRGPVRTRRVLDQPGGPGCIPWGPALSHGGPDSLLMPWIISLSLATWRLRSRPRGGVRRCCWPKVAARG